MNQLKPFILGSALLFFLTAHSQSVDFNFSTGNGLFCSPQVVTFSQNCTGNPTGFNWKFGNGQVGTSPVETINYAVPGTYSVKLIAFYATTAISVTKTIVI